MTGSDLLFFAAVAMLLLHEMDAIDKQEWRLLFVLRRLPSGRAQRWFIMLHFPLLIGLLVLAAAGSSTVVTRLQAGVDAFLVAHGGLHERLVLRGDQAFAGGFSRSLIWLAAAVGLIHLGVITAG